MLDFSKKILLGIVFILISSTCVKAQLLSIETVIDTNVIEIGRPAHLRYELIKNPDLVVKFPSYKNLIEEGFEILEDIHTDSVKVKSNKQKITQSITITSYEEGMYYLPSQPFGVITDERTDTVFSNPGYIKVIGVAVDTTNTIRDIANVEWIMPTFSDFLPYIILVIVLGILTFLIIKFRPKKEIGSMPHVPMPTEPPHLIAFRELDKLKAQKLWQQNRLKEYYTRLTQIIRNYIEQQFGILALEKTSNEIIREIRSNRLDKSIDLSKLNELLNLADLVKFARGEAPPEENILHLENAVAFIKASRDMVMSHLKEQAEIERINYLKNSFRLSGKIKNCNGLNDLEIYNLMDQGGRLVYFQYVISLLVITFNLQSPVYLIKAGDRGLLKSLPFSLVTLLLGWWGIPWGPGRSFMALKNNLSGGKKVEVE